MRPRPPAKGTGGLGLPMTTQSGVALGLPAGACFERPALGIGLGTALGVGLGIGLRNRSARGG